MNKRMKFTQSALQPEGNQWLLSRAAAQAAHESRRNGLGSFHAVGDVTLLRILSFFGPRELAMMCMTSHTFSAFASYEEFWQLACLRRAEDAGFTDFHRHPFSGYFYGSWKKSFLAGQNSRSSNANTGSNGVSESSLGVDMTRVAVYSDLLYHSYELVHGSSAFGSVLKGPPCLRLAQCEIPDVAAFTAKYEAGIGRPVLLERAGAASSNNKGWDEEMLRKTVGDQVFHAGGVNFKLKDYFSYARTNNDIQPLYLFDPTFGNSTPELLKLYEPPEYFRDDLFSLLESTGARPDYRWLLIGGARSGQAWHLDPNGTSAWSLTLRGRKRWLFFPPNVRPPGVVEGDGGECVTPLYLEEWAREFYKEACTTPGFCECETNEGDVMYVPRGWWHMVLNVAPITIAVSQHFISPTGLYNTLKTLREAPHEISGVDRGLAPRTADGALMADAAESDHIRRREVGLAVHNRLIAALKEHRPAVLAAAEEDLQRLQRKNEGSSATAIVPCRKEQEPEVQFSFNFEGNNFE